MRNYGIADHPRMAFFNSQSTITTLWKRQLLGWQQHWLHLRNQVNMVMGHKSPKYQHDEKTRRLCCTPVRVERFRILFNNTLTVNVICVHATFLGIASLKRIRMLQVNPSGRKGRPSLPLDYKSGIKFFVGTKHMTQYGELVRTLAGFFDRGRQEIIRVRVIQDYIKDDSP